MFKNFFEKNVGQTDRIVRIILGLIFAMLVYYFFTSNTGILDIVLAVVFAILTIIMIVPAFTGACPLYKPFNINTKKSKNNI